MFSVNESNISRKSAARLQHLLVRPHEVMKTPNRFEAEWLRLGLGKEMGSASVVLPPPRGFTRAYHLTTAEHGISDISLQRLKVARFSEVNDPFELFAASFHQRPNRNLLRRFKDSYNSKIGLLCFSANWTNPVLWSHYASRHQGICLGFDIKSDQLEKVEYKYDRVKKIFNDEEDPTAIPQRLEGLLRRTKSDLWEYEDEQRVFIDLSKAIVEHGLYFLPFSSDMCLKEVILGPLNDLSLESVRQLTQARSPHADVFKARLAFRSFRVVPDGRYPPPVRAT
jgi:hypothetical protein